MQYNKTQEINVVLGIIERYMARREFDFEEAKKEFIEHTKYYSNLTVKSANDFSVPISDLNDLKEAKECYEKAKDIYVKTKKIESDYCAVDKRYPEVTNEYHKLKIQPEFIELMTRAAVEGWSYEIEYCPEKTLYNGLENGFDKKIDELNEKADGKEISEGTYIYYDIMCTYLYDAPEFKEYMGYMKKNQSITNTSSQLLR